MNKQLKILLLLSIIALLALPLLAKHSDEFLMGSYSYLKNGKQVNYANREALCRYMQSLGYNSNIIETDANDPDLSGLLAELDKHGIDAWITDRGWNTSLDSQYRYASYPLSLSNHLRFEAEFASEADVKKGDNEDNQFWYAARSDVNFNRIGRVSPSSDASYGHVWQADKANDKAGYIFTDLRHRWPNKNGAYVRFGKEFHLYKKNPPSYEGDYLWVTFNFKLSNVSADLAPEEPLLRFMLAGYELSGGGFASQPKMLTHKYKDMSLPESLYRVKDYSFQKETGGFISIQLKVSYADLLAAKLLSADIDGDPATPDSDTQMILVNLNPRLYWYGNCDVQLDYVELEDQIYHELSTDQASWKKGIVQRMQNIIAQGPGNVCGFYTFDEPYQGQFASFKLMQNMLKDEGLKIFTANYDYQVDNIAISPQKRLFYDHEDNFRKVAEPILLAPDIYPITPVTRWNPVADKENQPYFIQNILDNKLIKVYRESKHYSLKDKQRQFYPIVQALGYWVNLKGQNQWNSWVQPPTATQKTLLYLPLCFGADGIFHYRLRGYQDTVGLGEYTTLSSKQGTKNYPNPNEDLTTYTAVATTNLRVKTYGKIIRNLSWLESSTIGTDKASIDLCPKNTMLNSLQVQKTGNGAYEGYIQCGYYLNDKGLPYYMIVNRRGDYFVPGAITEERFVPPSEYGTYYQEARPQTLNIGFNRHATKRFGKTLALFDPSDSTLFVGSGKKLNLSVPAGEGKLLQLTGTLPAKVKGKHKLNGQTILNGNIELQKRAKVVLGKNAELILLPGTHLQVSSKSKLYLAGTVTLLGDASISVSGKFKNKGTKINRASKAKFEVHGTPLTGM